MDKSNKQKMKEGLVGAHEESYKRRDDSGRFRPFFREDLEDVQFWSCGTGDHLIDIIPYMSGKRDPNAVEGKGRYVLDIFVHFGVGVNEDSFVCPARNYKNPCPICEHQSELRKEPDYDEDLVKSLNPSRRVVYNVLVYDSTKEEEKGVQIYAVAHWFMERHLIPLAKDLRTGQLLPFADYEEGKSIAFTKKGSGQTGTEFIGHRFVDRDYVIPDAILDQASCLDNLISVPTYDELKEIYWGSEESPGTTETAAEDTQPADERKARETGGGSLRGGSLRGGSTQEPAPKTEKEPEKVEVKEEAKTEVEESPTAVAGDCPSGGTFGQDLDRLDHCNDCQNYDACIHEADRLEDELKKRREERQKTGGLKRRGSGK